MKIPYKLKVLLNKLKEVECDPHREGEEYRCRCPAHDDNGPSFYIRTVGGKILVRCNADCPFEEICQALDLDPGNLSFDEDEPWVEEDADLDTEIMIDAASDGPSTTEVHEARDGHGTTEDLGTGSSRDSEEARNGANTTYRNSVYNEFLGHLELSQEHHAALERRGLESKRIERGRYRTAHNANVLKAVDKLLKNHSPDELATVPGFRLQNGRVTFQARDLLIPARRIGGAILAFKVRHDGTEGPKYTWASSKEASCGSPVHVPVGVTGPLDVVRLTEGELKADVATALSDVPTISAPGVASWEAAVPTLQALGAKKVLLAMDQDGKPGTLAATEKALYGLTRHGFEVQLEVWDGKLAKGIDDLLAAGKKPTVLTGLAAALLVRDSRNPPPTASDPEDELPSFFPLGVFPPVLALFCQEAGQATSTPIDFAAIGVIATAGAAIGNSRALCLKPNVWYESPRFYICGVGDPGEGKTPAFDLVISYFQKMQEKLISDYKRALIAHQQAKEEYEEVVKRNKERPKEDWEELPDVPPPPGKLTRIVVQDATLESLALVLEEDSRGLLMPLDEFLTWVLAMNQYRGGRGTDRQAWLKFWSGKGHLVDRKALGGIPISIPRPFVNVVGGIQPDMLSTLADHKGRNDGFLHRILFAWPAAIPSADWTDATVSKESSRAWTETLAVLRDLAMEELDDGVLGYKVVEMTPAAKEAWVAWYNAHAAETRSLDLPAHLIGPWAKLKSYAARLALVLHYLWLAQTKAKEADLEDHDLDVQTIERAVQLVGYFKAHLRRVHSRLKQTTEDKQLLDVLDWIRRKQDGRCTARDLARWKQVTPTSQAKKAMKELAEQGYGRIEVVEGGNGRKVNYFVFDPS